MQIYWLKIEWNDKRHMSYFRNSKLGHLGIGLAQSALCVAMLPNEVSLFLSIRSN